MNVVYIRRIPEGYGWLLDGFPTTCEQAFLLENALTGYGDQSSVSSNNSNQSVCHFLDLLYTNTKIIMDSR